MTCPHAEGENKRGTVPWDFAHCAQRVASAEKFPDNLCKDCPDHLERYWIIKGG